MKTTILSATVSLAIGLGAVAQQGNFVLDDADLANVLAMDRPANSYQGTLGMEVWVLKGGTSVPDGLNLSAAPGSGVLAYEALQREGFVKEATYTNRQTVAPGTFSLGAVFLPHAHFGGTVIVALAAWNNSAPSWDAMRAGPNAATRAGVVVFAQPTFPTLVNPGMPLPLAMDRDLVMTATPEPSVWALAALGGATLLLCRRALAGRRGHMDELRVAGHLRTVR